ncbi:MAG: hypothetical protein JNL38_30090 [Myxococcales bacterium]|nr:hypothetical protein [Myxococcales bacterium]
MKKKTAICTLFLASLGLASLALAQPRPPAGKGPAPKGSASSSSRPPASSSAPPEAPRGLAITQAVDEVAKALGAQPGGALVVAGPLVSDVEAPKGDELALRVAAQLAGRLVAAKAHPQTQPLAVARATAGRASALAYVAVEIAKGALRVTVDLYPVVSNGWERVRNPLPAPRAHGFAQAPIDAEVRSFLAPIVLERAQIHKAKHEEGEVVAVGCGDVDEDGGLELVVVSRTRVALGRLRQGRFVADRTASWSALSPRAAVPLREPLGGALISPHGRAGSIYVGLTDRVGVRLDRALTPLGRIVGVPVASTSAPGCAVPVAAEGAFEGAVVDCDGESAAHLLLAPAARYDAFGAAPLVDRASNKIVHTSAAREPSGKLRLRRGEHTQVVEGVGAQLAVADLDLDGVVEVATSSDAAEDVLSVLSWDGGAVRQRLRVPAPGGVRALAACPPEERGAPGLVAVVGSEVWLVR